MKHQVLSNIIKEISEKGDYYIPLESLKPAFDCDGKHIICVKEKLVYWAVENHVFFEYKEVNNVIMVRFIRR